jgi:hypothetical protein
MEQQCRAVGPCRHQSPTVFVFVRNTPYTLGSRLLAPLGGSTRPLWCWALSSTSLVLLMLTRTGRPGLSFRDPQPCQGLDRMEVSARPLRRRFLRQNLVIVVLCNMALLPVDGIGIVALPIVVGCCNAVHCSRLNRGKVVRRYRPD